MADEKQHTQTMEISPALITGADQLEHVAVQTATFEISEDALGTNLPKHYYRNWRFIGVVAGCAFGNNSQILAYVLSANSIPAILADLGPSSNVIWINLAFTLCVSVSMLISGRLADIFGRRWFVVGANVLNLIGCIIAATAQSVNTIIGGTVFIGIGAAVQLNFPMVISELVPNKHRSLWVGSLYCTSLAPYGFGAVIARELAQNTEAGWRWCYYIGIIIAACSSSLFFFCYHPPNFRMLHVHRSVMDQLRRQDYIGVFLFTGGLIIFLMGLSWGGTLYPWKSAHVIATVVVGFTTLVIFVAYEVYFTSGDQILPIHLFKAPGFISMTILAAIGTTVAYSAMVLWPQEVDLLLPGSPTTQGLYASVLGCTNLLGFFTGGIVWRFIPWHRPFLIFSSVLLTAMCGSLASVQPLDYGKAPALLAFMMVSIGWIEVGARALLPLSCPSEDIGAALGVMGSIGYAFAAIGTAVYVTVFTNKVKSIVPPKVAAAAIGSGLPESSLTDLFTKLSTNITAVPGMTTEIESAVKAAEARGYADSFRYVWYSALAFSLCALIASLFTINYREYYTSEVARKIQYQAKQEDRSNGNEEKRMNETA